MEGVLVGWAQKAIFSPNGRIRSRLGICLLVQINIKRSDSSNIPKKNYFNYFAIFWGQIRLGRGPCRMGTESDKIQVGPDGLGKGSLLDWYTTP